VPGPEAVQPALQPFRGHRHPAAPAGGRPGRHADCQEAHSAA
jgi:hypothetical protein